MRPVYAEASKNFVRERTDRLLARRRRLGPQGRRTVCWPPNRPDRLYDKQEHLMYIVAEEIADNPTAIARGHKERRTAVRHR